MIEAGRHHHRIRIYFGDTDAGGVVYHARYLELAERARTEALREAGHPHATMLSDHGRMFMVQRVNIAYFRPAVLDDDVRVVTSRLAETGATITLAQEFWRDIDDREPEALASLEVGLVCVSVTSRKPAPIPSRWRHVLARQS